jgi:hypothetical protein
MYKSCCKDVNGHFLFCLSGILAEEDLTHWIGLAGEDCVQGGAGVPARMQGNTP